MWPLENVINRQHYLDLSFPFETGISFIEYDVNVFFNSFRVAIFWAFPHLLYRSNSISPYCQRSIDCGVGSTVLHRQYKRFLAKFMYPIAETRGGHPR